MTFITRSELEKFTNKYPDSQDTNPDKYCNSGMEAV